MILEVSRKSNTVVNGSQPSSKINLWLLTNKNICMIPQTYVWDIANPTVWGDICMISQTYVWAIIYMLPQTVGLTDQLRDSNKIALLDVRKLDLFLSRYFVRNRLRERWNRWLLGPGTWRQSRALLYTLGHCYYCDRLISLNTDSIALFRRAWWYASGW